MAIQADSADVNMDPILKFLIPNPNLPEHLQAIAKMLETAFYLSFGNVRCYNV